MIELQPIWMPDTQQTCLRLLLQAMSRPGQCLTLPVEPGHHSAALLILATLLDAEVSLADPAKQLDDDDWPMLQVKRAANELADYVICNGKHNPDFTPKLGSLPSPEESATLIIMVDHISAPEAGSHFNIKAADNIKQDTHIKQDTQATMQLNLSGPGIASTHSLLIDGLNTKWLDKREDWISGFPMGVDLILLDDRHVVALPRTTQVEVI